MNFEVLVEIADSDTKDDSEICDKPHSPNKIYQYFGSFGSNVYFNEYLQSIIIMF